MSVEPVLEPAVNAPLLEIASAEPVNIEQQGAGIARATSLLALGTIASRALGFAQELLLAHFFGVRGGLVDAFQIAITVPRDLYDLAISGHVNSALVPVLSEYAARDKAELWRLVSALLGVVTLILSGLVLLLEAFAVPIVTIYRGRPAAAEMIPLTTLFRSALSAEAFNMTVSLLRITAPALLFLGLFAILSGLLYALKRFTAPAFAAALFNGTVVISMVALAPVIGIERAAIGWVLGAAAQMGLQFVGLRDAPIHFTLNGALKHPGVRRIGLLYIPVMLSLIIDVLINRTFSYNLASQAGNGSIAYMNWATSLREFPMGLVGTAISIAILPTLARQALSNEQRQAFKDTLGQGIRLVLSLIVPATVGMFVLAGPLVGLMFEHGAFLARDTEITALVLRLYLLGIPFAAVDLLLIFAFYARKDTLTPALVGVFSLACYMGIALLLHSGYSFYGLMIADSMKFLIHATLSLVLLRRRVGGFGGQRLTITLIKTISATTLMALVAYAVMRGLTVVRPTQGLADRFMLVLLPSASGAFTYVALVQLLRLDEFSWFLQALRRRAQR